MTPDETKLLTALFDRVRTMANQPRDPQAQTFIDSAIQAQPYAPYCLAQTAIIQEHALQIASSHVQQLEARLAELEAQIARTNQPTQNVSESSGSFLGDLGRSLFGTGQVGQAGQAPQTPQAPQPQRPPPNPNPWGPPPQAGPPQAGPSSYPQAQSPQPPSWGGAPPPAQAQGEGVGGFLKTALGAATGAAGGMFLANSLQGLFGGHRGGSSGLGSGSSGSSTSGTDNAGSSSQSGSSWFGSGGSGLQNANLGSDTSKNPSETIDIYDEPAPFINEVGNDQGNFDEGPGYNEEPDYNDEGAMGPDYDEDDVGGDMGDNGDAGGNDESWNA